MVGLSAQHSTCGRRLHLLVVIIALWFSSSPPSLHPSLPPSSPLLSSPLLSSPLLSPLLSYLSLPPSLPPSLLSSPLSSLYIGLLTSDVKESLSAVMKKMAVLSQAKSKDNAASRVEWRGEVSVALGGGGECRWGRGIPQTCHNNYVSVRVILVMIK